MSDSFTIYRNTLDALETYPPETAIKMLSYIGRYVMDGQEPDKSDPYAYGFFCQIKPLLDKSRKKAFAGSLGGNTAKQTVSKPKQTQANGKQTEANGKQTEAKEENRKEKEEKKNKDILSSDRPVYEYREIIDYLNRKAGTQYKYSSADTKKHIQARYEQGFTTEDFFTVIDKKVAEWRGTDMGKYLRPSTLFGTKFESYLNQETVKRKTNSFNNFEGRDYDYDALERQLIESQDWGC